MSPETIAKDPFGWVSDRQQRSLLLVLTALLVLLSLALARIGAPLATPEAPSGIVAFELAGSARGAERILGSWTQEAREHAMLSLGLDYLYLVVYPAWISLACAMIARRHAGRTAALGRALAWSVLAAGLLDAVENWALIRILVDGPSDGRALLAALCAAPKFALVLLGAVYGIGAGGALLWRRTRAEASRS